MTHRKADRTEAEMDVTGKKRDDQNRLTSPCHIALETPNKWLHGQIAALRGARHLAHPFAWMCLIGCVPYALRFIARSRLFSASLYI